MRIRSALRLRACDRSPEEKKLLREYWRKHRRRSRDRLPAIKDHRCNEAYHSWLRGKKWPVKYSRETYEQWRREVACRS
jgi:hypothetical protein